MKTGILDPSTGDSSIDPQTPAEGERAVLTIATGKDFYWNIAVSLARSFERWNANNDIRLVILTDIERKPPPSLKKTEVLVAAPGSLGQGFSSKLQLDQFAPAKRTLFVDADCLCVGSLEPLFERFAGRTVSVIGGEISAGEWFGDVKSICARTGVSALPKFNGGVYYLERGTAAAEIYERARELEPQYDDLGMVRLRDRPNDELLMAVAMAQFGCSGIEEDGSAMGDLFSTPEIVTLDVLRGECILRNPDPPSPNHRPWFSLRQVNPRIVHFLGHHIHKRHYRAEALKLLLTMDGHWPKWTASVAGSALNMVLKCGEDLKSTLRPAFRRLFGTRKIKPSPRMAA